MKLNFRRMTGYIAAATACVMLGSGMTLALDMNAQAENDTASTVVVTSPFTAAIAQVRDSVVGVSNYQLVRYSNYSNDWYDFGFGFNFGGGRDRTPQEQTQEVKAATGSGVVVGKDYVLTNYHVVEDATKLEITVAREGSDEADTYAASLVAYDENLDVAVLYAPNLPLNPVTLGDSDSLQVGDWAICIGNPLGEKFSGTVTQGIVSALNRAVSSESYDKYGRRETITNTMIQTDAAINSGNSGGGMFSVTGELMGIPTLKYSGSAFSGSTVEGIGMCIPINAAKPLIEDVLSGKIKTTAPETTASTNNSINMTDKPRMGITMTGMNTSSAALRNGALPNGVYVLEVEKDSPAEKAGMQVGDIIVDVNDTVITSTSLIQQVVSECNAGDTLKVKVYRVPGIESLTGTDEIPAGEYIDLEVTLAVMDSVKQ